MTQAEDPLNKSTILGLVAMALAVLVVANDFTALSVALPAMEQDFGADVTTVQWVINGYALVFGVLIVTGGRLADMFGRRRIFFLGASLFAVFSLTGGCTERRCTFGMPRADGRGRRHDVAGHPRHDLCALAFK
jgi:predicted MFS family arabinose efflux permease